MLGSIRYVLTSILFFSLTAVGIVYLLKRSDWKEVVHNEGIPNSSTFEKVQMNVEKDVYSLNYKNVVINIPKDNPKHRCYIDAVIKTKVEDTAARIMKFRFNLVVFSNEIAAKNPVEALQDGSIFKAMEKNVIDKFKSINKVEPVDSVTYSNVRCSKEN